VKKYIVEFVGTFFFILTIGQAVLKPNDAGALAPLAIGSALMVMIYAGGHISGGHYNPAVTLGVTLRGKCSWAELPFYWAAQILAAVAAGAIVLFFKGKGFSDPLPPGGTTYAPVVKILAEFLFTFALVWVVLNVATAKGTAGNSFYGLAIGFTVLIGAFSVGSISGGAFNPAVAVGITVMRLSEWANLWIFLVGDFLGAIVAALAFKAVNDPADA
jgi:aquaporin Z